MKKIEYFIVDVFAKNKYEGNQLAVFLDLEDELNGAAMLNMAKEINFAESTFIKKQVGTNRFAVKIFTPESEIPFAGHPSIGTSFVIANYLLKQAPKEIILHLVQGEISVTIAPETDLEKSLFQMTQTQPVYLTTFTKAAISKQLDIPTAFLKNDMPIQEISTGLPYIILPIKNLSSLEQIKLTPDRFKAFLIANQKYKSNSPPQLSTSLFFYTDQTYEAANDFNTRMFCLENDQLIEDAATGSANGCFLAYLLKHQQKEVKVKVEQGFQMGRKSYLYLEGKVANGQYDIKVGGYSKLVSTGYWIV